MNHYRAATLYYNEVPIWRLFFRIRFSSKLGQKQTGSELENAYALFTLEHLVKKY